jgi:hypothetical protein
VRYAFVDRTVGALATWASTELNPKAGGPVHSGQNKPLGEPVNAPALEDVDGDGLPEIVFTTRSGRVGWWNDNGSLSPGWPPRLEREGFQTFAGPLPLTRSNQSAVIVASLGNGVLTAVDAGTGKKVSGFPLGLSVFARGTGAFDNTPVVTDGPPILFAADGDTLLRGIALQSLGTLGGPAYANWAKRGRIGRTRLRARRVFQVASSITAGRLDDPAGHVQVLPEPRPAIAGHVRVSPQPARERDDPDLRPGRPGGGLDHPGRGDERQRNRVGPGEPPVGAVRGPRSGRLASADPAVRSGPVGKF